MKAIDNKEVGLMAMPAEEWAGIRNDDTLVRFFPVMPVHKEHRILFEDVRTCARCGETAPFREAGGGGWATCGACGALA